MLMVYADILGVGWVFGLNWSPVTAPEKCESAVGPFCQPGQDVTDTLAHPKQHQAHEMVLDRKFYTQSTKGVDRYGQITGKNTWQQ